MVDTLSPDSGNISNIRVFYVCCSAFFFFFPQMINRRWKEFFKGFRWLKCYCFDCV